MYETLKLNIMTIGMVFLIVLAVTWIANTLFVYMQEGSFLNPDNSKSQWGKFTTVVNLILLISIIGAIFIYVIINWNQPIK